MNACEARGGYKKQEEGGGGGGGAVRFRSDTKSGKGGGRAACRTMIYILVCKHVRNSAWGVERKGGG